MKSLVQGVRGSCDPAMTEAIAFDTHRFVKHLTDGGLAEQQAEVLVDANLATRAEIEAIRAEIEALRQETKAGIEILRQETKAEIAKVEARVETIRSDLLKWMFGALIAQGGLIVALVRLLQ